MIFDHYNHISPSSSRITLTITVSRNSINLCTSIHTSIACATDRLTATHTLSRHRALLTTTADRPVTFARYTSAIIHIMMLLIHSLSSQFQFPTYLTRTLSGCCMTMFGESKFALAATWAASAAYAEPTDWTSIHTDVMFTLATGKSMRTQTTIAIGAVVCSLTSATV